MQIAFVTHRLQVPADSGSPIRSKYLARGLARRADVHLYAAARAGHWPVSPAAHDLEHFRSVTVQPSGGFGGKRSPDSAVRRDQIWVAIAEAIGQRHAQNPFDVIVYEQIHATRVATKIPSIPFVLDEHNIESDQARHQLPLGTSATRVNAERMYLLAQQRRMWRLAARVTCTTAGDAATIREETSRPVDVVPNGVSLRELPFRPPSARVGRDVLFIGHLGWPPNVAATRFLARDVMPRVWTCEPAARLVVCGKDPAPGVMSLREHRVEITGTVPSVVPFLHGAAVYANALFDGGGSSLKILEALAAGLPLVSTAIGVRGHNLLPGVHYVRAEGADAFAQTIVQTLGTSRAALDLQALRGRALAATLDWGSIGDRFAELVEHTARMSRRSSDDPTSQAGW
jgi:glycosyltransferase involved in cell wall biosynthesis